MVRSHFSRGSLTICALVLGLGLVAPPAFAQTGQVRGKVLDAKNQPIEGAKVTIVRKDGGNPKFEITTKRNGEFLQAGVPSGDYIITATKDKLTQSFQVKVGLAMNEVNFALGAAGGSMSKEEAAENAKRIEAIKAAFAEGATLSNEGKYDEAIVKFEEVIKEVPTCAECYVNIGSVKTMKKDYEGAEAAYKTALTHNPESVDAYNGLATLYNAQKKFKEAQAMSAEASKRSAAAPGGGGNADALYNQGVIAWNANDFTQASEHFAAAIKANPQHAEAHFMLGRAYLNLGKLPEAAAEFQEYVKIAPDGPNAKEATTNVEALKPYIKK
jgi:tetratricopeptide (TPR) repeat protein